MLYSINGTLITEIPKRRLEQWNLWEGNLPKSDNETIFQHVNNFCDENDYFISSFVPNIIWEDKTCTPLLNACNQNMKNAGFFFGLIMWMALIQRDDEWIFKPAENDDEVLGTTYWRK